MKTDFSSTQPTLIQDKLDNLEKHMKFVYSPAKTKTFTLLPHYKFIWPKREQDNCYNFKSLRVKTKGNSIEFLLQVSLPYISFYHGPC